MIEFIKFYSHIWGMEAFTYFVALIVWVATGTKAENINWVWMVMLGLCSGVLAILFQKKVEKDERKKIYDSCFDLIQNAKFSFNGTHHGHITSFGVDGNGGLNIEIMQYDLEDCVFKPAVNIEKKEVATIVSMKDWIKSRKP